MTPLAAIILLILWVVSTAIAWSLGRYLGRIDIACGRYRSEPRFTSTPDTRWDFERCE